MNVRDLLDATHKKPLPYGAFPNYDYIRARKAELLKPSSDGSRYGTPATAGNSKDAAGSAKAGITALPMQVVERILEVKGLTRDVVNVLSECGLAMEEGARKYGRHNYRATKIKASTYVDAVWRHMFAHELAKDEIIDADSGLPHVTKAIAGLMVLYDAILNDMLLDDRPMRPKVKSFNYSVYANAMRRNLFTNLNGNWWERGGGEELVFLCLLDLVDARVDLQAVLPFGDFNAKAAALRSKIVHSKEPFTEVGAIAGRARPEF